MITITSSDKWITISHDNEQDYFTTEKIRIDSIFKYDRHTQDSCVMIQYGTSYLSFEHDNVQDINGNPNIMSNEDLYNALNDIIDPQI